MTEWKKPLEKAVRQERNGWRDEWISHRHRDWGFDCPAKDIDFLLVEYDERIPVALIEYKHMNASESDIRSLEHHPIRWLADKAGIPFAVVLYDDSNAMFRAIPKNANAVGVFKSAEWLTEADFVCLLYKLRNRQPPARFGAFNDNEHAEMAA